MKPFLLPFSLLIVLVWAAPQPAEILTFSTGFLPLRKAYTHLTGALALGWMGFCMLLALRPAWLERALGGLDELYRVHKWSGIGAASLVAAHWLLELSPHTLIAWGWIERGPRRAMQALHSQGLMHLGRDFGEWAAWVLLALAVVSLLRLVPYGWFRKSHKAFPIVFLIGAAHSVIMLLREELLATSLGALILVICAAGGAIAVISLAGRVGRGRRHDGRVVEAAATEAGVFDLSIDPGARWPGHAAGQFALVTLDPSEGPHPFTIVSAWRPGARLRFAIKSLGDYTRTLSGRIRPGDAVIVEGPYGRFDFGDPAEDQVWVAGGVGIAPFLARLEALAAHGGARGDVHLFYCVKSRRAAFPDGLEALCAKAGVTLHLHVSERDGRISTGTIGKTAKRAGSVWFCGPRAWGEKLRSALWRDHGLPPERFHRERFEFR
jgi:predicted ferric reductase